MAKKIVTNLTKAFAALRKAGYFARQNFKCCSSCAWYAVPEEKSDKAVFYHAQNNDDKVEGRPFHLAWDGDGDEICRILNENGVETLWDGNKSRKIEVTKW